jgi:hypothetical protein
MNMSPPARNGGTVLPLLIALIVFVVVSGGGPRPTNSVALKIKNRTGKSIDVYWVNVMTGTNNQEYVLQNQKPIRNGTGNNIFSYDTHSFLVEFHNPVDSAKGVSAVFTKGREDEDVIIDYDPMTMDMTVQMKTKKDVVEDEVMDKAAKCKQKYNDDNNHDITDIDSLIQCISSSISEDLVQVNEDKDWLKNARSNIAHRLRNYTCADIAMESSLPIRKYGWNHLHKYYDVDVLLEKPTANIWLMHNFITDDECDILMSHGRPRLQRATVAADDGTSIVSENRKAQQAAYMMDHMKDRDDPLNSLYKRIFAATNQHTGYTLDYGGQEGFTIIQYNPDDQYTPHCDGNCDGALHNKYGRVATAVMYCKVPISGGATTFTNNDIYIKPRKGSVTFFSYKDMKTGLMDDGDTEHSGCPVIEGEKWITTVWMREGVSDIPGEKWDLYDPDGTRIGGEDVDDDSISDSQGAHNTAADSIEKERDEL